MGWFTYMARCADATLYTGITTNLGRRIHEHNFMKKGSKYTRSRRPVELCWHIGAPSRGMAMKWEHFIRSLSKYSKEGLVQGTIVTWSHPRKPECIGIGPWVPEGWSKRQRGKEWLASPLREATSCEGA